MPDKENDCSPGEMGPCVQSQADDLIDDRAVDLLAQFDEALLKGTLKDATALMESIPEELVPVIRSNQRFLAYLRETTQTGQFADRLAGEASSLDQQLLRRPTSFGRFQVIREIGCGSQGIVFLAHDPALKRNVAIKVPRWNSFSLEEHRQRFQREAEILGRLTHPNIVSVYEVCLIEPVLFIASDYCDGPTLAEYLKAATATISPIDAAKLVKSLASAIHYAHERGVVHRDIKPTNIILSQEKTVSEDRSHVDISIPKLVDFGLAYIEDATHVTRSGIAMGTITYMSPEQAQGQMEKIGPATDIYALGAILYELLVGQPPIVGKSDPDTLQKIVTTDPVAPHRRLRSIPLDLSTIVMKCLDKVPESRYRKASDLEEDLQRFLDGLPTIARPIGPIGQSLKYFRKFPAAAISIFVIIGLLAVISIQSSISLRNIKAARELADRSAENERIEKKRAEQAELEAVKFSKEAQRKAVHAQQTSKLLLNLFRSSDPMGLDSLGLRKANESTQALTAAELLDRGRDQIMNSLLDQPLERAEILEVLGDVYRSQGRLADAEPLIKECLKIRSEHLAAPHTELAASHFVYGQYLLDAGLYIDAEKQLRTALEQQISLFGAESTEVATTKFYLGWTLANQHRDTISSVEAKRLIEESRRVRERLLGRRHRDVATCLVALAAFEVGEGNYDAVKSLGLQSLLILGSSGDGKAVFAAVSDYQNAVVERRKLNFAESARLYELSLKKLRDYLGDYHPAIAMFLGDYAGLLREAGRFTEAEQVVREAIAVGKRIAPQGHPELVRGIRDLGIAQRNRGEHVEAEQLLESALQMSRSVFGEVSMEVVLCMMELAELYQFTGRAEAAIQTAKDGCELSRMIGNSFDPVGQSIRLAAMLDELGCTEKSKVIYESVKEVADQDASAHWATILQSLNRQLLYAKYYRQEWTDEDRRLVREINDPLIQSSFAQDRFDGYLWLTRVALESNDTASALSTSQAALELAPRVAAPGDWRIVESRIVRSLALQAAGQFDEAEPGLRDGYADAVRIRSSQSTITEFIRRHLVKLYQSIGNSELVSQYDSKPMSAVESCSKASSP